jgi:hypothetical protein
LIINGRGGKGREGEGGRRGEERGERREEGRRGGGISYLKPVRTSKYVNSLRGVIFM